MKSNSLKNIKPVLLNLKKSTKTEIIDCLINSEKSIQDLIDTSNKDIVISLQNLRAVTLIDEKRPKINEKLYAELIDTITYDKKKPLEAIYDERLKHLTVVQEKIYKILAKIQEDLIDEQDTEIKHKERQNVDATLLSSLARKIYEYEKALDKGEMCQNNSNPSNPSNPSNDSNEQSSSNGNYTDIVGAIGSAVGSFNLCL